MMAQGIPLDGQRRRAPLRLGVTILAAGCAAAIALMMSIPGHGQAGAVSQAAAAAGGAPAAAAAQAPAAPVAPAAPPTPVDARKQVPRVDLIIDYLADTRGSVEPCG